MELPDIAYDKSGPLAYLTLNRPEIKNAFTYPMFDSLCRAAVDAKQDPEIKILILRGRDGVFSAGGDVKAMAEGSIVSWEMKRYLWENIQRFTLLMEDLDKPIIASLDGPAYGGGMDLALACDMRIASERATFCSTFVRIGMTPGDGGTYFLPRLIPLNRAMEILLTGRVVRMDEALRLGIVDRVVPAERLSEETERFAMEIAQWPLTGIRAIKRAVYSGLKSDLRTHLDYTSSQVALLSETEEHRSAVRKLAEQVRQKTGPR